MKRNIAKLVRFALTGVILVGLVLFARTVNWRVTWERITEADYRLLAVAAVINLASLALKAVRWWIFLRPVGAPSLWMAVKATFAGAGLNNILVANGGEAARVIFVARAAHVPSAKVLATLALERMFELVGYIVLLALAVSFLELPHSIERTRPIAWLALVGVTALMVFLVRRPEKIEAVPVTAAGWRGKLMSYLKHFLQTLASISTGPRFTVALLLSVGVWAMQVWTYSLTARSADFNLPLVGTVAAILAVNLGFAMRATPGNVGVFQAMYALIAVGFGMDKEQAIAVAFLIQTQQILPITALGVMVAPEFIFNRKAAQRSADEGLELVAPRDSA